MNAANEHLKNISEIRSLMEKSSRFISLSGLSGIFAGIFAILGAIVAYIYLGMDISIDNLKVTYTKNIVLNDKFIIFFLIDSLAILTLALSFGLFFSYRKAKKNSYKFFDATAKHLAINLMIPLATGGIFCLALLYHGIIGLIAPSMLIFYGLALINGSKHTLKDIRYLGICEIFLGIVSLFLIGYGYIFWIIGFGILHIIYGIVLYKKYDK